MSLGKRLISGEAGDRPLSTFMASFEYTGNGGSSQQTISGFSFTPEVIFIFGDDADGDNPIKVFYKDLPDSDDYYYKLGNGQGERVGTSGDNNFVWGTDSFSFSGNPSGGYSYNKVSIKYVGVAFGANNEYVSNSDGTDTVQVNAFKNAGFSIIKYTGTGSAMNFGHGLSQAPQLIHTHRIGTYSTGNTSFSVVDSRVSGGYREDIAFLSSNTILSPNAMTADSTTISVPAYNNKTTNGESYILLAWHEVSGVLDIRETSGNSSTSLRTYNMGFDPKWFTAMIDIPQAGYNLHYLNDPYVASSAGSYYRFGEMYNNASGDKASVGSGESVELDFNNNRVEVRSDNFKINSSLYDYIYITWGGDYMEEI